MKCECGYHVGGPGEEPGTQKFRLKVTLLDSDGRVHGPCRDCGQDVTVATGAVLKSDVRPAIRLTGARRRIYDSDQT